MTAKRFRAVSSRLLRSIADLVSKNGRFLVVFGITVLKTQDDRWFVQSTPLFLHND